MSEPEHEPPSWEAILPTLPLHEQVVIARMLAWDDFCDRLVDGG